MVWLFPSCASLYHITSPSTTPHQSIHQSINPSTNKSTHPSVDSSIDKTIKRSAMSQSSRVQSTVYAQSPLRNITSQDSVQTASSTRASRSSRNVSLRDAIHSALGSGSPVELLPNPPRRTSSHLFNRASNTTSPLESRRSSSTFSSNEITSSPTETAADPAASLQAESNGKMPPVSWSLDDAVYATPAGKGCQSS
jgi:hypothetical protein